MENEIETHVVIFKESNPYTGTGSISMTMRALFDLYADDMGYIKTSHNSSSPSLMPLDSNNKKELRTILIFAMSKFAIEYYKNKESDKSHITEYYLEEICSKFGTPQQQDGKDNK